MYKEKDILQANTISRYLIEVIRVPVQLSIL